MLEEQANAARPQPGVPSWLVCDVDAAGHSWWSVRLYLEDRAGPSYFGPFEEEDAAIRFYGDALVLKQAADVMGGGDELPTAGPRDIERHVPRSIDRAAGVRARGR